MKRFFLLFFFACCLMGRQSQASDQNLVHGAGTLPHLTSAVTLNIGLELPPLFIYSLRYDIGLCGNIQLGISAYVWEFINGVEIHATYNVLNAGRDSDFLSIYLNPGIFEWYGFPIPFLGEYNLVFTYVRTGVAVEHRFGKERGTGLYLKAGFVVPMAGAADGEWKWPVRDDALWMDGRFGLQALISKKFSFALEPYVALLCQQKAQVTFGGKAALTWAF